MCRTVADAAHLFSALADAEQRQSAFKRDCREGFETIKHSRIGIVSNFTATPEIHLAFSKAVETFRASGCAVREVKVPFEKCRLMSKKIQQERSTIAETLFKTIDVFALAESDGITADHRLRQKAASAGD